MRSTESSINMKTGRAHDTAHRTSRPVVPERGDRQSPGRQAGAAQGMEPGGGDGFGEEAPCRPAKPALQQGLSAGPGLRSAKRPRPGNGRAPGIGARARGARRAVRCPHQPDQKAEGQTRASGPASKTGTPTDYFCKPWGWSPHFVSAPLANPKIEILR